MKGAEVFNARQRVTAAPLCKTYSLLRRFQRRVQLVYVQRLHHSDEFQACPKFSMTQLVAIRNSSRGSKVPSRQRNQNGVVGKPFAGRNHAHSARADVLSKRPFHTQLAVRPDQHRCQLHIHTAFRTLRCEALSHEHPPNQNCLAPDASASARRSGPTPVYQW